MDAPLSGAIFTTTTGCPGTNQNIFASKDAVYLDGGPSHPGAAGLPDGSYFVKVTDPGGGTLLGKSLTANFVVVSGEPAACYQLSALVYSATSSFTAIGYDNSPNGGGEYKVWVSPTDDFAQQKTDNFKVKEVTCDPQDPNCNPLQTSTLRVRKYYDANANGVNDGTDPAITGWKTREHDGIDFIRYTPVNLVVDPDTYEVSEFSPLETNWLHTGCAVKDNIAVSSSACVPGLDSTSVILAANSDKTVEFGNVCLGGGGGLTLGFWSNKNGQATMNDGGSDNSERALLSGLNLVGATGLAFDPANYAAFRTWLLSANATNMAYMLSAQLAAMELNVEAGKVSGTALVYAPCLIGSAANENALGFISINDLMDAANTELGAHPNSVAAGTIRSYQECLKNALDSANNNLNFVQATPCPFSFGESIDSINPGQ